MPAGMSGLDKVRQQALTITDIDSRSKKSVSLFILKIYHGVRFLEKNRKYFSTAYEPTDGEYQGKVTGID